MVRWSSKALDDLERVWHFHADWDVDRADRIEMEIRAGAELLETRPEIGRHGRASGTREYLLRKIQYVLVYIIEDSGIRIARVQSTAERV